jgi:hypothetical protein
MSKITIQNVEYNKTTGYDKKYKEHYKQLETKLNDKYLLQIQTFNNHIIVSDKFIRVIATVIEIETKSILNVYYLSQNQSLNGISALYKNISNEYKN